MCISVLRLKPGILPMILSRFSTIMPGTLVATRPSNMFVCLGVGDT